MCHKMANSATFSGEKTPENVPKNKKRFFLYSVVKEKTKPHQKTTITLHERKGKNETSPKNDNYFTRA